MAGGRAKREWRQPGRRQGYRVLAPERHLIVCEGEKTEPLYFKGLRDALKPEFRDRIHIVVKGTGLHTTDLLDYALRECGLSGGFDHVWLAYDRDDFDPQDFDSVAEACKRYSDGTTTFHPLWSNPCVEVWMLFHFGIPPPRWHRLKRSRRWTRFSEGNFAGPTGRTTGRSLHVCPIGSKKRNKPPLVCLTGIQAKEQRVLRG